MSASSLTVEENAHQQSVWWRALPLLYDRFVCTPLPVPTSICVPLPAIRPVGEHSQSVGDQPVSLSRKDDAALSPNLLASQESPSSPIDFLVSSDEEVFVVRLKLPDGRCNLEERNGIPPVSSQSVSDFEEGRRPSEDVFEGKDEDGQPVGVAGRDAASRSGSNGQQGRSSEASSESLCGVRRRRLSADSTEDRESTTSSRRRVTRRTHSVKYILLS